MDNYATVIVNLYNTAGKFVAGVHVFPFQECPDIIKWGTRYFCHQDSNNYKEVFAVVSFTHPRDALDERCLIERGPERRKLPHDQAWVHNRRTIVERRSKQ